MQTEKIHEFLIHIVMSESDFRRMNTHRTIRSRSTDFVTPRVPTNFENASGALVGMDKLSRLRRPNVHALVERTRRQKLAMRREGNGIHRLCVLSQRMDAHTAFNVPQADG